MILNLGDMLITFTPYLDIIEITGVQGMLNNILTVRSIYPSNIRHNLEYIMDYEMLYIHNYRNINDFERILYCEI